MKRLLSIQSELNAPKNLYNKFGGYAYRSCEAILESVKPLLLKNNLTLTIKDELVNIGDRYYVKAVATLLDAETGNIVAETTAFAREEETKKGCDQSQITGASSSYARKYALNGLFLIDDAKDSDATNTHDKEPKVETKEDPFSELKKEASTEKATLTKKIKKAIKDGVADAKDAGIEEFFPEEECKEVFTKCMSFLVNFNPARDKEKVNNSLIDRFNKLQKSLLHLNHTKEFEEISKLYASVIGVADDGINF